ncbi:glycoside hydrolase family 55 protein [Bacillus toyonensis]|nr:glycoside hydrolase family 55 protein [Bacillus toyonensis]MDT3496649.1 glycoside hydrolase family 55 protein [Bacillus toyonensis]
MANIRPYLQAIKHALFGKDVRGSIHDGMDAINKETEVATALSKDTQNKQSILNAKYNEQIAGATDITEIKDFHVSGFSGDTFQTMGLRADEMEKHIHETSQSVGDISILGPCARNMMETLLERGINVKDYGAKGDGKTNETAAFHEAIEQALILKVPVFVPGGTYLLDHLNVEHGLVMVGAGMDSTVLKHTGAETFIRNQHISAIGQLELRDFKVVLNVNTAIGIYLPRVYLTVLDKIEVYAGQSKGDGIVLEEGKSYSSFYNTITDVSVNGTNRSLKRAFVFKTSANSNRLMNCRVVATQIGCEVDTFYTNHINIIGNAFENTDIGVKLNGATGCLVLGNRFENNGSSANGIGVQQLLNGANIALGNAIIGNFYTNIKTSRDNQLGSMDIGIVQDFGGISAGKYFSQLSGGGWTTAMDMRNYPIENMSYANVQVRDTAPGAARVGSIAYADGKSWRPLGDIEGLVVKISNGAWESIHPVYRDNPPTEGTWNRGFQINNKSAGISQAANFLGWVCVEAGTPGVWKRFGVGAIEKE